MKCTSKNLTPIFFYRNKAAVEKSQELAKIHNVKSAAYQVDGM